jgi:malonate-semialdehyde dehydrogenase (acetylating)/methylmalonate-semialdehyde dehydrogenase
MANEWSVDTTIGKEEIFGPVANIIRVKNMDEAVDMVERSVFGNYASIFTNNGA